LYSRVIRCHSSTAEKSGGFLRIEIEDVFSPKTVRV
jgi:hypothetical protein